MPASPAKRNSDPTAATRELNITRVFDAPRDLVWKAWTDPGHLAQWWGPHSFSNPVCEVDARPGGKFNIHMRGPDGTIYPGNGTFVDVVRPERLVFTQGVDGIFEVLTTVTFTEDRGRTTLKLNARVTKATDEAAPYLGGMEEGWSQSLERLRDVATPTGERQMFGTRIVNAPRELVWTMWTEPEHIAKWWGPTGFTNTIETMDVRPGGVWKFIMHGPDGRNYANRITYTAVVKPERIEYDHESTPRFHVIVKFDEQGPRMTRISMRGIFDTIALRDNTVKTFGAIEGLHETLGRLAKEIDAMATTEQQPFSISRTFDAPRDVMWKAWTESDRLAQWFGPKGVKVIKSNNDLRPGGVYHYGMRTPDGNVMWGKWVYRKITKPERLVFVASFSDENGGMGRHPLSPDWPLEMLSTITFNESGGKTTVTIEWIPINATQKERDAFEAARASMTGGWTGTLDQLEAYLATAK